MVNIKCIVIIVSPTKLCFKRKSIAKLTKLKTTTEIEFNNNRIQMTVMNVKCTTCIKSVLFFTR